MKSLCTSCQLDNLNSCGWSVVHNGTPLWLGGCMIGTFDMYDCLVHP